MLAHVWRRVVEADCVDRVLVATDDDEIASLARSLGAEVARTGPARCGTHRVALAVGEAKVSVLNVQADQPFLEPETLRAVTALLDRGAQVATACAPLRGEATDRARVKILVDEQQRAIAFSREPLLPDGPHYVHIGIYGFGPGWLPRCAEARLPADSPLIAQDLEQLAWLAAGIEIRVATVARAPLSVDTPEDLQEARRALAGPDSVSEDNGPGPDRGSLGPGTARSDRG